MKKNIKRFLVVSPKKELWDESKPILFLGEWCNLFNDRNYNKDLDIKINPNHWNDKKKQEYDYGYLESLYEAKLMDLNHSLSKLHGLKSELRYWRIIIGPWLKFFIDAVFDRYETIRLAKKNNSIEGTFIYEYNLHEKIPNNFNEFYDQLRNDSWNELLFFELIKEFKIPFKIVNKKAQVNVDIDSNIHKSFKSILKSWIYSINNLISNYFNEVVLFELYLSTSKLIKLQIKLGQIPFLGNKNILSSKRESDLNMRKKLVFSETSDPFSKFLNNQIINFIPRIYIENFNEIKEKVLRKYPRNPKLIVTANAYQANDSFKIWTAHHTKLNVPLIIHQHGGTFGISKYNQTETHQLKISDYFISWGWKKHNFNNIKILPALKVSPYELSYDKINGEILLTLASTPRYFYNFFGIPNGQDFLGYIEDQKQFINYLDKKIIEKIKIRFDSAEFGWNINNRISEVIDPSKFESPKIDLLSRLKKCKLCISTYNATIFLETLAMNVPTIVFFNIKQNNIRKEAIMFINQLKEVGIFHDSPISASNFLNKIESNIEDWWQKEDVQNVVKVFCQKFVYNSKNWNEKWVQFLIEKKI